MRWSILVAVLVVGSLWAIAAPTPGLMVPRLVQLALLLALLALLRRVTRVG